MNRLIQRTAGRQLAIDDKCMLDLDKLRAHIDDYLLSPDGNFDVEFFADGFLKVVHDARLAGVDDKLLDEIEGIYYVDGDFNDALTRAVDDHGYKLADVIYHVQHGDSVLDEDAKWLLTRADGTLTSAGEDFDALLAKIRDAIYDMYVKAAEKADAGDNTEFQQIYDDCQYICPDDALVER